MFCESTLSAQVMLSHLCIQSSKRIKNMVEKDNRLLSETPLFVFGDILRCQENRRFPVSFLTDIYSNLKFPSLF